METDVWKPTKSSTDSSHQNIIFKILKTWASKPNKTVNKQFNVKENKKTTNFHGMKGKIEGKNGYKYALFINMEVTLTENTTQ